MLFEYKICREGSQLTNVKRACEISYFGAKECFFRSPVLSSRAWDTPTEIMLTNQIPALHISNDFAIDISFAERRNFQIEY